MVHHSPFTFLTANENDVAEWRTIIGDMVNDSATSSLSCFRRGRNEEGKVSEALKETRSALSVTGVTLRDLQSQNCMFCIFQLRIPPTALSLRIIQKPVRHITIHTPRPRQKKYHLYANSPVPACAATTEHIDASSPIAPPR